MYLTIKHINKFYFFLIFCIIFSCKPKKNEQKFTPIQHVDRVIPVKNDDKWGKSSVKNIVRIRNDDDLQTIFKKIKIIRQNGEKLQVVPAEFPLRQKNAVITSYFGLRDHPILSKVKHHNGIDIAAPLGMPVIATADGIVKQSGHNQDGYGNKIMISHGQFTTVYAHLDGLNVKKGDTVKQNQTIGYVGSTGLSTNPHLHYEVMFNGEQVDAYFFIKINRLKF